MKQVKRNEMVINMTQHKATDEQVAEGVMDIESLAQRIASGDKYAGTSPEEARERLVGLLTFAAIESGDAIRHRAELLADLAVEVGAKGALIGGAPYLMGPLESALKDRGIVPLYSFTERVSVEETLPDGSVKKTNVFKHVGFVGGGEFPAHDLDVEGKDVEGGGRIKTAWVCGDAVVGGPSWRPEFRSEVDGVETHLIQVGGRFYRA